VGNTPLKNYLSLFFAHPFKLNSSSRLILGYRHFPNHKICLPPVYPTAYHIKNPGTTIGGVKKNQVLVFYYKIANRSKILKIVLSHNEEANLVYYKAVAHLEGFYLGHKILGSMKNCKTSNTFIFTQQFWL